MAMASSASVRVKSAESVGLVATQWPAPVAKIRSVTPMAVASPSWPGRMRVM